MLGNTALISEPITIAVHTPSKNYDVVVGQGLLDTVGALTKPLCTGTQAYLISDSNVAPLYADAVAASLTAAGFNCKLHIFPAGEQSKNADTLVELLEGLASSGLTREDLVVALGGGVCGDLAGLAAALYLRGCKVIQIPTSLLAMVDSSVGGKTAIDLKAGKNLAGAFWQPSLVVADIDCLDTISADLLRDSCGEVIKHAVLADPQLFDTLLAHPFNAANFDAHEMVRIVARNVEIKRNVVDADEKESGLRQTLNLGHTIGHAIEAASDFNVGHGSCVAAGLCCMAWAAAKKSWCTVELAQQIEQLVVAFGLPHDTTIDHETLFNYAIHDKKRHADGVNIIVPISIGKVEIRRVSLDELRELIDLGCGR